MGPTRLLNQKEAADRLKEREASLIEGKDETELRLEKLLFGDEAGFLDSLKAPTSQTLETGLVLRHKESPSFGEQDVDSDIGAIPDDELFFLDAGASDLPTTIAKDLQQDEADSQSDERVRTWYDSDDDRVTVSLASNTRLRKLRDTEVDDVITGTEYVRRLRRQYERLHPEPEWARYARKRRKMSHDVENEFDSDMDMDEDFAPVVPLTDLLRSTNSLSRSNPSSHTKARKLRSEVVDIQKLKDIADKGPSSIDTLQFHPSLPLILSAGPSSTVNIYHLSPEHQNPNPLLTSLHIRNMPLHTAAFCTSPASDDEPGVQDRSRVFLSSRRRYFHTWSLSTGTVSKVSRPAYGDARHEQKTMEAFKISPCGRYMGLIGSSKKGGGSINVLSTKTMQWICSCRIDSGGGVADFAWWSNGEGFAVIGKNGEVSEYEIESRKVLARWTEEGSVGTTVIAMGGKTGRDDLGGDRWVAVGSSSGVVSVYDRTQWSTSVGEDGLLRMPKRPKPNRTFDQLTTPVSFLEFAQDGQMLIMGSRWKKNALRLVHLPSCTVYQNWPTDKTPLGRISSLAMSNDGNYLAVANEQGRIRLWQIRA